MRNTADFIKNRFRCVKEFAFVSAKNGPTMDLLKLLMMRMAQKTFILNKKLPLFYTQLELMLEKYKQMQMDEHNLNLEKLNNGTLTAIPTNNSFKEILTLSNLQKMINSFAPNVTESMLKEALLFLNDMGTLLYFGEELLLNDIVILDLQWLAKRMSDLISFKVKKTFNFVSISFK